MSACEAINIDSPWLDLRRADCMDMMKEFEDNHFDLAIVDPPYGIGADGENACQSAGIRKDGSQRKDPTWKNPKPKGYIKKEWDQKTPEPSYFSELRRVATKQIVWGGNYFTENLPPSGGWVTWEKGVSDGMTLSQCEMAWTNCRESVKHIKLLWSGYRKCEQVDRIHPTQKPVQLYKWLLTNYAKPGERILDTHMGSGSIAIACHYFGAHLTACEIDGDYFRAACQRIERETRQTTFWEGGEF